MKNLKLFTILAACVAITAIGCKKGDTGPAGARGPAGPDSVLHSSWIVLNTPLSPTDSIYEQSIPASALTSKILDSGVVLSYIGLFSQTGTDTLVYTLADINILYANNPIGQELAVGQINLYAGVDYSGVLFRYVLIPGSVVVGNSASGIKYTKKELQTMSYAEVTKTFGIPTGKTNN